ncbi:MAG: hypothetical protein AAF984_08405 [Verrucomicrobiota bacterium]
MRQTLLLLILGANCLNAASTTALDAYKLAREQVNKLARESLVQIDGKPHSPSILPNEWIILFYDPYADQNGTMVRIAGKTIVEIRDGFMQMGKFRMASYKQEEILDVSKLKVDSDDVLKILRKSPLLTDVKISSLGLWLKKDGKGPLAPSLWYVTLYGLNHKADEIEFGEAEISAYSGKIVRLDVNLKKIEPKLEN